MMMYVKWQDVGCEVNVEMVVCGQVIRGGRKAVVEGKHSLREGRTVCVCVHTNNHKYTGPV